MPRDTLRYGSLVIGIVAGIISIPFFLSIPFFGVYFVLVAGIISGMIARGVIRGVATSATAGLVLAALAIGFSAVNTGSFISTIYSDVSFSSVLQTLVNDYLSVMGLHIDILVEKTMIYVVAFPIIGGFIGGALRPGY